MRRSAARAQGSLGAVALLCGAALACDARRPLESRGAPPQSFGWSRRAEATSRATTAEPAPDAGTPPVRRRPEAPVEPERPSALDATDAAGSVSGPFIIDALVDVAAAGPIAATERGVAMYDRENRLYLARLEGPLDASAEPRATRLAPLPDSAGPFSLARGPAVRRGLAYWVSRGRLLGQSLASAGAGTPLVLADDARIGTRAAVPVGPSPLLEDLPQVAAYIARPEGPDGPPSAKLWIEGHDTGFPLTDGLASGHSVALAATPKGLQAIILEARTGMSSVHWRALSFSKKQPVLGEDHVVWVGGAARASTELFALPSDEPRVRGFLALERDITHFGLVGLDIPLAPGAEFPVEPDWRLYDNGIEPSPFALATLCGRSVVLLARPSSPVPHAVQELVLIDLDAAARASPALVARSRAFFDVALASMSGGALLAYVADHRTWARSIRCARP